MKARSVLAYAWASPNTALGLLVGGLASLAGGRSRVVEGVVEFHGGGVTRLLGALPVPGRCAALTLGHVVLGCDARTLDQSRPHELVHVAQYERWGPLFVPAYLLSSLLALTRGEDAYGGNAFEKEAELGEVPSDGLRP